MRAHLADDLAVKILEDRVTRSTTLDLSASLLGRAFSGGLQFLFTPVYVALLGMESYGLVGFYLSLLGILLFLDQAVTPVIIRRFASNEGDAGHLFNLGDTFKTMEALSICTGLAVSLAILVGAPWLSENLLRASQIEDSRVTDAVRLMALMVAMQWTSFMYAGVLTGLGRQVALNSVRGAIAALQWGGGAALLVWVRNDILLLFAWQASCFALQSFALRWQALASFEGPARKPAFSVGVLTSSWRFASGAVAIGITGSILTHADKIFVSRHVPLTTFAAYSLSFTIASLIPVFIAQPMMAIVFPRFARIFAIGDLGLLAAEYRRWTQAIAAVVMPLAGVLVLFPEPVLSVWLANDARAVSQAASYLPWIALGTMLNVVMLLPFNLQMARGWTSLSSTKNLLLLPPFLIALGLGVPTHGPIVGAICWFAINLSYYLIEVPIMHSRLLKSALVPWWLYDTLLPAITTACAMYMSKLVLHDHAPTMHPLLPAATGWLAATVLLVTILPLPRKLVVDMASAMRRSRL